MRTVALNFSISWFSSFLVLLFPYFVLAGNNSGAAFSIWPDTGQSKCYSNSTEIACPAPGEPFDRQDAQHAGPSRSYTVLGGGTMVEDTVTGLIWEVKDAKDDVIDYTNPHDADNLYYWCDTDLVTNGGDEGTCTGSNDSQAFLEKLNSGEGYGGYHDWRLPTYKELATLFDVGLAPPAIDPVFAATTQSTLYWSSTTAIVFDPRIAWCVSFDSNQDADLNGGLVFMEDGFFKNQRFPVRAVRGGLTPTADHFVDNGDSTVTDTVTNLQWLKGYLGPISWQEALAAGESSSFAGHSDWRLPDKNELRSLIDYSRDSPAIDPVFVSPNSPFWSSTTRNNNAEYAWVLDFFAGNAHFGKKDNGFYVRLVRGNVKVPVEKGDLNGDTMVNLQDAVLGLLIISGKTSEEAIELEADSNGDRKIGLAEVVYILNKITE